MSILRKICAVVAGLVAILAFFVFVPLSSKTITFADGGTLRITPPTRLANFLSSRIGNDPWAKRRLAYHSATGAQGTIILLEDWWDSPMATFPSADGHTLFCYYFEDIKTPLLKFDTARPYDAASATKTVKSIVASSPWRADEATLADWDEVIRYFEKIPDGELVNLLPFEPGVRADVARKNILDSLRHCKDAIQRGFDPSPWIPDGARPANPASVPSPTPAWATPDPAHVKQ